MKGIWCALLLYAALAPAEAMREELVVMFRGETATVQRSDYRQTGLPFPDEDKLAGLLERLDREFHVPPVDARLDARGRIVPDEPGYRLDRNAFSGQFHSFFFGSGSAFVEAPMRLVRARVDSELLAQIKEKPIGHYVTYFNPANRNRAHNIALAAKAVNNTVVFPGETFSFNRTVGRRTKQRGYVEAPIIVRGELSEGIGGGICQVSSTLYNAADRAGLKIVQRYSHSRSVPYVRPGRDATVSWHGPDFVFRNPYDQPVLLRTSVAGGRVYAAFYSSDAILYKPRKVPSMSGEVPEENADARRDTEPAGAT